MISLVCISRRMLIIMTITLFSAGISMPVCAQGPASEDPGGNLIKELLPAADNGNTGNKETSPAAGGSVMKIKRLDDRSQVYSFELKDAEIKDIFRVLAYDYKLNLLVDGEVEGKVTAAMTNVSLEQFLEAVAESLNLIIEESGDLIKVRPNLVTKVFAIKYVEAQSVLSFGESAQASGRGHIIYDLLSKKGKIFLGRQPNSIMVIDYPPNIKKIEDYLKEIDQRVISQVFRLKYLKASDIVGEENNVTPETVSSVSQGE